MVKQRHIREKNLIPFLPGQSGNPAGRPPNSVTSILKRTDELTNEQIAQKLIDLALAGDLSALIHYIDRTDGKVADKLQMTGTMLVVTPDQLNLAMRMLLDEKAKEEKFLSELVIGTTQDEP